eukprot:g20999.t1
MSMPAGGTGATAAVATAGTMYMLANPVRFNVLILTQNASGKGSLPRNRRNQHWGKRPMLKNVTGTEAIAAVATARGIFFVAGMLGIAVKTLTQHAPKKGKTPEPVEPTPEATVPAPTPASPQPPPETPEPVEPTPEATVPAPTPASPQPPPEPSAQPVVTPPTLPGAPQAPAIGSPVVAPSAQPVVTPPTLPGAPQAPATGSPVVAALQQPVAPVATVAPVLPTQTPSNHAMTGTPMPTPVPSATPTSLEQATTVSGAMFMSEYALAQCEVGCKEGLAAAFGLQSFRGTRYSRRRLAGDRVLYFVTMPGINFEGMAQSINRFQTNYLEVARRLGVPEDEVIFSPLHVATSSSPATLEDVPLVMDPSASEASASAIGMLIICILALLLGTSGCLLAACWRRWQRQRTLAKRAIAPASAEFRMTQSEGMERNQRAIGPASAGFLVNQSEGMMGVNKSSDAYIHCDSEVGSARLICGSTPSGSADDIKYDSDYNPVRTGGVTSPNAVKAQSPTPSQTQAAQEDGAVVRAAQQPRSASSSPSNAVMGPSAVASSIPAAAAAATTDHENAPDTPRA